MRIRFVLQVAPRTPGWSWIQASTTRSRADTGCPNQSTHLMMCTWSFTWCLYCCCARHKASLTSCQMRNAMCCKPRVLFFSGLWYTAADMSHHEIAGRAGQVVQFSPVTTCVFFQVRDDDEVLEQWAGEEAFFPRSEWHCCFLAALQLQEGESMWPLTSSDLFEFLTPVF